MVSLASEAAFKTTVRKMLARTSCYAARRCAQCSVRCVGDIGVIAVIGSVIVMVSVSEHKGDELTAGAQRSGQSGNRAKKKKTENGENRGRSGLCGETRCLQ